MSKPSRTVVTGLIEGFLFGPVDSRRLGKSLGINPFPAGLKICTFNCPYCECGWTHVQESKKLNQLKWPALEELYQSIKKNLEKHQTSNPIDALTFAGNGEPTLYPDFISLVEKLVQLKSKKFPKLKIALLTNATTLEQSGIKSCLEKIDEVAYKLDAGQERLFQLIDAPIQPTPLNQIVVSLKSVKRPTIQSMFVQGRIDNTTPSAIEEWLKKLKEIQPGEVQIYSIDRKVPDPRLTKVDSKVLNEIAAQAAQALPDCKVNVY